MHLEIEKNDNQAQLYNLKRRLEEVLGDKRKLAIWTNLMLKEGGYAKESENLFTDNEPIAKYIDLVLHDTFVNHLY